MIFITINNGTHLLGVFFLFIMFFWVVSVFITKTTIFIMTEADVKRIIRSEFNNLMKDSLDKEMKSTLQKQNSASRQEVVKTITNSLEAVFKVLWQKREFWKTDVR